MKIKVKITDIVYDTGLGISVGDLQLPTEMIVEVDGIIDIESEIAYAITDKTSWFVEGYNYEVL
jgi:hypothetical protein